MYIFTQNLRLRHWPPQHPARHPDRQHVQARREQLQRQQQRGRRGLSAHERATPRPTGIPFNRDGHRCCLGYSYRVLQKKVKEYCRQIHLKLTM